MDEYSVERILSYLADDAWAVEDGKGNQIMRFAWDKRQEAESLAEALNAAWRNGHAEGVSSVARPRLAPRLSRELRNLLRRATGGDVTLYPLEFDAIRAALAALGEE